MIYVLSDDPDGAERVSALKQQLGEVELRDLNTAVFDGERLSFDELVNACEAMPFLSSRRLIVVRGLLTRLEPKTSRGEAGPDRKAPELARQIADYLSRLPPHCHLALVESALFTKRNPLHKALIKAEAELLQTVDLRGEALVTWIERRVAGKGGRLGPGAAQSLAGATGGDLWALDHELDKLVAYAADGVIEVRAIAQLVAGERTANVYKLGDAIAEGNLGPALAQLRELIQQGEAPAYLAAMMIRQFRLLIQAKDLLEAGDRPPQIATRLGLPGFVAERLVRQLRRYPRYEQLEAVQRKLLESDVASKTGRGEIELCLELLIADQATARR